MSRIWTVVGFLVATAVVLTTFASVGTVLGELSFDVFESLRGSGQSAVTSALIPLIAVDVLALLTTLAVSFAGGVRLPSGLPHVFFAMFVPLMLGALQVRFFELSGDPGNLAETFGGYNFVAMFVLSIAAAQLGVHLSRSRYEGRLQ